MLKFHEPVMTPNGAGLVQGRMVSDDPEEDGLVIVSHKKQQLTAGLQVQVVGIWMLKNYREDELTPTSHLKGGGR